MTPGFSFAMTLCFGQRANLPNGPQNDSFVEQQSSFAESSSTVGNLQIVLPLVQT